MTNKDLENKTVFDKLISLQITNKTAANLLWLSVRQIIRKKKQYVSEWIKWLIHKLRWKSSNNNSAKKYEIKYDEILKLKKDIYYDYNTIHFREKLLEKHDIKISYWTLRNLLIKNWLIKYKKRKMPKQYQKRERAANYWELVQYDGSYHKWLEDRNWWEELCLLVKVDDATWKVFAKFDKSEWLTPTMNFWKEDILENGKPRAIYLDKFSTYKINHKHATNDKELPTQFWKICQTLWIKLIFANSPQWKWRVERMNSTLQDRLIKELREENISDIDSANKFLKEVFLPKLNKQFSVQPREDADLHIKLTKEEINSLNQIFSKHSERKLRNDFTISFNNEYYQLYRDWSSWKWPVLYKWDTITVEEHLDWTIHLSKRWKYLIFENIWPVERRWWKKQAMAPVADFRWLDDLKEWISELEKIEKIKKENEIELLKTNIILHVEKTWDKHRWMKNEINK